MDMKRNNSRIKAMMLVYNYDITNGNCDDELPSIISEELEEVDELFASELFTGVINNIDDIDFIISKNLENYGLDRLNYVDRALIRIGTYEMKYLKTPKNIVINEIVNLSKQYTQIDDYPSSKFNNKLLDNIARYLENDKQH